MRDRLQFTSALSRHGRLGIWTALLLIWRNGSNALDHWRLRNLDRMITVQAHQLSGNNRRTNGKEYPDDNCHTASRREMAAQQTEAVESDSDYRHDGQHRPEQKVMGPK